METLQIRNSTAEFLIFTNQNREKTIEVIRKKFVKMKLTKIKEVLRMKKNYLGGGLFKNKFCEHNK